VVNEQLICKEKDISRPLRAFELQNPIRLNLIAALLLAGDAAPPQSYGQDVASAKFLHDLPPG